MKDFRILVIYYWYVVCATITEIAEHVWYQITHYSEQRAMRKIARIGFQQTAWYERVYNYLRGVCPIQRLIGKKSWWAPIQRLIGKKSWWAPISRCEVSEYAKAIKPVVSDASKVLEFCERKKAAGNLSATSEKVLNALEQRARKKALEV